MTDGLLMKLKYIREWSVPPKGARDGDGKEGEMGKRCMINISSSSRSCLFLAFETRSQLFQCPSIQDDLFEVSAVCVKV